MDVQAVDYRPSFPAGYSPGIGIVGCGEIVTSSHLPAYGMHGLNVVGVYDVKPAATAGVCERFGVGRVFESLDELLARPEIEVVDIATQPDVRPALIERALAAGKHVLAQKPLALDLQTARKVVAAAGRSGLALAVNQNGRWSPPWRIATLLIEGGAVGEVSAVTHLYDKGFEFAVGTVFDEIEHFLLYDYSVHWFDITRCWLDGKTPETVRAVEYRTPAQPAESKAAWGAWAVIEYADGSSAVIRSVGGSRAARPALLFWIHGTEGTIRGSVGGSGPGRAYLEQVELERAGEAVRYALEGGWHPDGFAGTMGELLSAIAEGREPYNSARHNLLSLELTLAACRSADEGGRAVSLGEPP
jgi:predicted dehydrogenase